VKGKRRRGKDKGEGRDPEAGIGRNFVQL